jgi:HPt (histidine-containing phosphotransfer) domain-containing protein
MRDATGLTAAAHRLKGAAGNLGAQPLCKVAGDMESMARRGDLDSATARFPALEEEFRRISVFVKNRRSL